MATPDDRCAAVLEKSIAANESRAQIGGSPVAEVAAVLADLLAREKAALDARRAFEAEHEASLDPITRRIPKWARTRFPFAPPKPMLRIQLRAIEWMLAPLSDKRTRRCIYDPPDDGGNVGSENDNDRDKT